MIAIPDFAAGAMENWGLITYRESALLYTPGVSAASNKQRVCAIVAHELAHQVIILFNAVRFCYITKYKIYCTVVM